MDQASQNVELLKMLLSLASNSIPSVRRTEDPTAIQSISHVGCNIWMTLSFAINGKKRRTGVPINLASNTGTGKIQPFLVLGIFILTTTLFECRSQKFSAQIKANLQPRNPRAQPSAAKRAGLIWGREMKSSWRRAWRGNYLV